jgi:hypothetical protein
VFRHISENTGQRSDPQGIVIGNCDVMFSQLLRREADVRSFPAGNGVAEDRQGFD